MYFSICTIGINQINNLGAELRGLLPAAWKTAIIAALLIFPGGAYAEPRNEYLTFRIQAPGVREVTVPDTATMDQVLEIFRSNDITVDGPRPILVDDGSGGQVVAGYELTVELMTSIAGKADEANCPYWQTTELLYGMQGRLLEYKVSYLLDCIE